MFKAFARALRVACARDRRLAQDAAEHQGAPVIALIDYGAGNLTSVRKGFAAAGAELFTPTIPAISPRPRGDRRARRRALRSDRGARRGWRAGDQARGRRGHAAARHLPGHAVAVRGQRRSARRRRARRYRRHVHAAAATGRAESPARRLELAACSAALAAARLASTTARRCISRIRTPPRSRRSPSPRARTARRSRPRSNGTTSSASSSIPEKSSDAGHSHPAQLRRRGTQGLTRMLSKRLIACLDVRNGCVVKGVNFEDLREAGRSGRAGAALQRRRDRRVVMLDVTATIEDRRALEETIRAVVARAVHPADRRRRHPHRGRRRGGARRRGGQGRREQRGARAIRRC